MRVCVAVLLLISAVHADEAADAVLKVFRAEQDLKPLAAKDNPDPWLVADELCGRGEYDAADAFARAAPRPDTERLPEYVVSQREKPTDPSRRKLLVEVKALVLAEQPKAALAKLKGVDIVGSDAASIRIRLFRAVALEASEGVERAIPLYEEVARAGTRVGWLRAASWAQARAWKCCEKLDVSSARTLTALERLVTILEQRHDRLGAAEARYLLAKALVRRGRLEIAQKHAERSSELFESIGSRSTFAIDAVTLCSFIDAETGRFERAVLRARKALGIAERNGDAHVIAVARLNAASRCAAIDAAGAIDMFERALREPSLRAPNRVIGYCGLGEAFQALGEMKKARAAFRRALSLAKGADDRGAEARALRMLGDCCRRSGAFDDALKYASRSLALEGDDPYGLATLGNVLNDRGRAREAIPLFEKASAVFERTGRVPVLAVNLCNLAAAYHSASRFEEARSCVERALALAEDLGDRTVKATALSQLGRVHFAGRRSTEALRAYEGARRLFEALEATEGQADVLHGMAGVHLNDGRYRQAVTLCKRSLQLMGAKRPWQLPPVLMTLGRAHANSSRFEEARAAFERAGELWRRYGRSDAKSLQGLAFVANRAGDHSRALELLQRAAPARGGEDASILLDRGQTNYFLGDYPAALALLRRVRSLTRVSNPRQASEAANYEGMVHRGLSDYQQAMKCQNAALRIALEHKLTSSTLGAQTEIANIHLEKGEYARAIELLELVRRESIKSGLEYRANRILSIIGTVRLSQGRPDDGARCLQKSLARSEEMGDLVGQALALVEMGRLQPPDQALALYDRALAICRQAGAPTLVASVLSRMSATMLLQGDFAGALQRARRAQDAARRSGNRRGVAHAASQIGDVYWALGDPGRALKYYEQLVNLEREIGIRNVGQGLLKVGGVHEQRGDLPRALAYANEALKLETTAHVRADALALKCRILREKGEREPALRALAQAEEIARRAGYARRVAYVHEERGEIFEDAGDYEGALKSYRAGLTVARSQGPGLTRRLASRITTLLLKSGRVDEALPLLEEEIEALEMQRDRARGVGDDLHARFVARLRSSRPYERMARAQRAAGRPARALAYLERGRARGILDLLARARVDAMAEAERRARARGDRPRIAAIERLKAALAMEDRNVHALTFALSQRQAPGSRGALKRKLAGARAARAELLAERALLVNEVMPVAAPVSVAGMRALLAPRERLIYYSLADPDGLVFVVAPDGAITSYRIETSRSKLEQVIVEFRRGVSRSAGKDRGVGARPTGTDRTRVGERLFEVLVPGALRKQLAGVDRVYVVPHGPLHGLPFEALPGWRGDLPVAYVHSGSVLAWCRARSRRRPEQRHEVVAVGDPIYARGKATPKLPESGVLVVEGSGKLAAGDVLMAYGGAAVESAKGLALSILKAEEKETVAVRIWRAGRTLDVEVPGGPLGIEIAKGPLPEAWKKLRDGGLVTLQRGGPLKRLPGTRDEVKAIARTFERTKVLLGDEATKARLFEFAPQARFLHLATHQIVDETEFRGYSRLALTAPRVATPEDDGFLSLFELFEKWRDRLSGCELVVLSACETVKGPLQRDEGPYAMPLGFLYAGAPAVIGSLWRVDDASTAKLFARFYEELKAGKGKLEAFTAARKWLKKKYPDPYHWAPFVFIGDPR